MRYVYLYVCDGKVPGCEKTACKWAGRGDCRHTTDSKHARYPEPHEWAWQAKESGKRTFCELVREES